MTLIEYLNREEPESRIQFAMGWMQNESEHHPRIYTSTEVLEILEKINEPAGGHRTGSDT